MSTTVHPTKPLDARELASRWQAMCADPAFDDVTGKVELDPWGDVLMNAPVGKTHALLTMDLAKWLSMRQGRRTMAEAGILTAIGVRAPDGAWCSDSWLAALPEEAPLASAPEICIEIESPSNTLPELRLKTRASLRSGRRDRSLDRLPGRAQLGSPRHCWTDTDHQVSAEPRRPFSDLTHPA